MGFKNVQQFQNLFESKQDQQYIYDKTKIFSYSHLTKIIKFIIQFLKSMKTVKKFFAEFDMFSVAPTLRSAQQPQTSSLCSGVTSFLTALFFSYVFINSVVKIITFEQIDSIQTESRKGFDEISATDVFFGVRVGSLPLQISTRYFDIGYYVVMQDGTNQTFPMHQCNPSQWKKLGSDYQSQYQNFKLYDFFCPLQENVIDLKKVYYAPNSQYAAVFIRPCTVNTSANCQSQPVQRQYFADLSGIQGSVFITLYLMDEAINPNNKQPVSRFLNTDPQFSFTTLRGVIATVELGSYRVQTDISVFPVQSMEIKEGNFLHSFRETSIQVNSINDNFAMIYLSLNRKHIMVQRKVGKLDDMLSYAGGLFSIITGFLGLFIVSFNKYRYQLMVAEGVFHQDQDGNKIRQNDFTFRMYIKYTIFDWMGTLFCYQPKWHDCELVDSTRDEANKQMDVTRLFRKIEGLQFAIFHLMEQKQRECLSLLKPQNLGRIKRNRLLLQYYNLVIQSKASMSFQQHRISTQILKFGLMLLQNQENGVHNKINNSSLSSEQDIYSQAVQIDYEQLHNVEYLLKTINEHFKNISAEAEMVQLEQQQQQIEADLAMSFFQLSPDKKQRMIGKIPIKILYRLAKRYLSLKREQEQQSEKGIRKKKKVTLNIVEPPKIFDFHMDQTY